MYHWSYYKHGVPETAVLSPIIKPAAIVPTWSHDAARSHRLLGIICL